MRVLAVADEVSEALYGPTLKEIEPDLIVSCGDLPFEYLEYLVTLTNVPLLYVLGNHDPCLTHNEGVRDLWKPGYVTESHRPEPGPQGCTNIDGRLIDTAGLRLIGLGGSRRYKEGPHQFTETEMRRRATRLEIRTRIRRLFDRRGVDLVVTHAPPRGVGDVEDGVHEGFVALHGLVTALRPRFLVHGHVHPYGNVPKDAKVGTTTIVNAVGYRVLDL